jgi:alpha-galactosidase
VKPAKIVIIGAGSTNFGLNSVATLLREPTLRGSTLTLVDLNARGLELVHRLVERMNLEWDAGFTVESSTDRREMLPGADFVVCAIEVGSRDVLWKIDWEVTLRHGLRQPYAENGGPGGFAHAARNIPAILDIALDMERLCPEAYFVNLSNPLPRLCRAVSKYTSIRPIGLCHQFGHSNYIIGTTLPDVLGLEMPAVLQDPDAIHDVAYWDTFHSYLDEVEARVDVKAAGLNHFTWMLDVRDRRSGDDLYPELRRRIREGRDADDSLTRDLLRLTGYVAVSGGTHLSEYVSYLHNPVTRPWERYRIEVFDWDDAIRRREEGWETIARLAAEGGAALERLRYSYSEGVYEIVHGITHDANLYRPSINVTNEGAISNLPDHTIVEVPAIVTGMGVVPLRIGELPPVVSEFCRREAERVELVVDAAALGSREIALQALALDSTIDDLDMARAILDDYLETHRQYLPQFHGEWQLKRPSVSSNARGEAPVR